MKESMKDRTSELSFYRFIPLWSRTSTLTPSLAYIASSHIHNPCAIKKISVLPGDLNRLHSEPRNRSNL